MQAELLIQAFGRLVTAVQGHHPHAQKQQVYLLFFSAEFAADGVNITEEGDVAFDEGDGAIGV